MKIIIPWFLLMWAATTLFTLEYHHHPSIRLVVVAPQPRLLISSYCSALLFHLLDSSSLSSCWSSTYELMCTAKNKNILNSLNYGATRRMWREWEGQHHIISSLLISFNFKSQFTLYVLTPHTENQQQHITHSLTLSTHSIFSRHPHKHCSDPSISC